MKSYEEFIIQFTRKGGIIEAVPNTKPANI